MEPRMNSPWAGGRSLTRGVTWLLGMAAWAVATLIAATVAFFFAASLIVFAVLSAILLALSAASVKARRTVRAAADPQLLEARRTGGHSWVAYGWDGRR